MSNASSRIFRRRFGGLINLRERWSLSWHGWVTTAIFGTVLLSLSFRNAHNFLTTNQPVTAEYLIIEGWIPDYALDEAVLKYREGAYRKIITSGTIQKDGWNDSPKYTAADWAAGRLKQRGLTRDVVAVPCYKERADRTFHSALAVREWFDRTGTTAQSINVVTLGAHARRSRLLFQKAFGPTVGIGIIAIEDRDYDPDHWWQSSDGARQVCGEMIAYLYARLFFWPSGHHTPTSEEREITPRG